MEQGDRPTAAVGLVARLLTATRRGPPRRKGLTVATGDAVGGRFFGFVSSESAGALNVVPDPVLG